MARLFNQFLHAGERYNDKVIVANFGREFDEKEHKQTRHGGYLVVCKCGYGYVARCYGNVKGTNADHNNKCPYCEGKLKKGEC
nr:MAG TPA: GENERAL NEGATIVE REGULATOR OF TRANSCRIPTION, SIGNALING PROTEIN, NOT4 RING.8A [Caudoviricetes sp.]